MGTSDDEEPGPGDRTEVVPYDEASKRRPSSAPLRLGRYTLDKIIAQGGMAEIWLATLGGPSRFSRKVALKRIRPGLVKMAARQAKDGVNNQIEMFVREARLLASLKHQNIVEVIELGVEPAQRPEGLPEYFIAMEFLEGLTLRDLALRVWQARLALPLEIVVRAIGDACLGLDHVHQLLDEQGQPANLVHRDISPDNLFLTTAGVTKLLDFGIAKREDWSGLTVAGELKGKVPYMAPEQLKGERVDGRTDLYSVGVVLYWLLTGRRPIDGPSEVFTMKAILDDAPRPLRAFNPQVPPLLEEVVLSCLEKDPANRISSASALHDTLSMLLLGLHGAPPDARAVVKAAEALKPASTEVVPDVAAVPVQGWTARPAVSAPTYASPITSAVPDIGDVSQMPTVQSALGAQISMVERALVQGVQHSLQVVVDAAHQSPESPTYEPPTLPPTLVLPAPAVVPAAMSIALLPPDPNVVWSPLHKGIEHDSTLNLNAGAWRRGSPADAPVPTLALVAAVGEGAGAPGRVPPKHTQSSKKDQVPAALRDPVEYGLEGGQSLQQGPVATPSLAPSYPAVSVQTSGIPMRRPRRRRGKAVPILAGVVAAFAVLWVIAVAVGALPNPLATVVLVDDVVAVVVFDAGAAAVDAGAAAVDAGAAAVDAAAVVDSGSAAVLVPAAVDSSVAVVVDAGVAVIDAGVAQAVLGVVVADAGADVPVDDEASAFKKKIRIQARAQAGPAGNGVLVVRVRPWAKITIDGVEIGITPQPAIPLPAGKHQLRLESGSKIKNLVVTIKAKETTTLQVNMTGQ